MQGPHVMEESASSGLITAVSRPNEVTAGPHHIDWIRHLPFSSHTGGSFKNSNGSGSDYAVVGLKVSRLRRRRHHDANARISRDRL